MKHYKKIGIALDNSSSDETILKSLLQMREIFADELSIHVLYVDHLSPMDYFYVSTNSKFSKALEEKKAAVLKSLHAKTEALLDKQFDTETRVHYLIGSPTEEVAKYVETHQLELMVVGKKDKKKRVGRFSNELLRRTDIPVLTIPYKTKKDWHLDKILVPYDFSKLSDLALVTAKDMQHNFEDISIECVHVLSTPIVMPDIALTGYEILEVQENQKVNAFNEKVEKLKMKPAPSLKVYSDYGPSISKTITKHGQQNHCSLIIMGAKGHSVFENFFLGSVTENLLARNNRIPVLVVK